VKWWKARSEKMKPFSNIICNGLSYKYGPFLLLDLLEGGAGERTPKTGFGCPK
jgi:hypothetical protein